jgi:hypothetical protein
VIDGESGRRSFLDQFKFKQETGKRTWNLESLARPTALTQWKWQLLVCHNVEAQKAVQPPLALAIFLR